MRIKVLRDHDHRPDRVTTVAFKGGRTVTTKRAWGEAAVAAGAAEEVKAHLRPPTSSVDAAGEAPAAPEASEAAQD